MNNALSYVAAHKGEYEEIHNLLEHKLEELPGLERALYDVKHVLERIKWYEEWGIDMPWDSGFEDHKFYAMHVKEILNQGGKSINPDEDMLVIPHHTGAFIFSCSGLDHEDSPVKFFNEFIAEVKKACPPDYEDTLNNKLYYKKCRAAEAYKLYNEILAKYRELNVERIKQWRIEKLERQLKEAKEDSRG